MLLRLSAWLVRNVGFVLVWFAIAYLTVFGVVPRLRNSW